MLGAIIGDIIGSRFEFLSTQEKEAQLFHAACSWTDDSVCTAAVARVCEKLLSNTSLEEEQIKILFFKEFKKAIKNYPMAGYGKNFQAWTQEKIYKEGDSAANGCLMRVSPVALYFNDLETVLKIGRICTQTSHNHPDSLRSVAAYLEILFYLKNLNDKNPDNVIDVKNNIRDICTKYQFSIESIEHYHRVAGYWILAADTFPRAVAAYLDASDFLGTYSNIIYLGSDTDTTATVAGTMSELTYGIKPVVLQELYRYFDHLSFDMVKSVCYPYIMHEEKTKFIFGQETYAKILELYRFKAVDQTAAYDPLEIPSDELYYNGKPPPKSLTERFLAQVKRFFI